GPRGRPGRARPASPTSPARRTRCRWVVCRLRSWMSPRGCQSSELYGSWNASVRSCRCCGALSQEHPRIESQPSAEVDQRCDGRRKAGPRCESRDDVGATVEARVARGLLRHLGEGGAVLVEVRVLGGGALARLLPGVRVRCGGRRAASTRLPAPRSGCARG